MSDKSYVLFVDVGWGHEEPIYFSAEPSQVLEKAYAAFLEAEVNENILQDVKRTDDYLECYGLPKVFELTSIPDDVETFKRVVREKKPAWE